MWKPVIRSRPLRAGSGGNKTTVPIARVAALVAVGVVAVVAMLLLPDILRPRTWHVRIATATPGGTYYPMGRQLARILRHLPSGPIGGATADSTNGSRDNIRRLLRAPEDGETVQIALVMGPAIVEEAESIPEVQNLRILTRLYSDVLMILARDSAGITSVHDMEGSRVFVGLEGSGTRSVATRILEAAQVTTDSFDQAGSFTEAASRLIRGDLEAAFFMAAMPAQAVQAPLDTAKARLLSLSPLTRQRIAEDGANPDLREVRIPANTYPYQPEDIHTVAADVFLVARSDLPEKVAFELLEALFDNLADLHLAHPKAQDIRVTAAFDTTGMPLQLHAGARRFQQQQRQSLRIATGALNGRYYLLGERIQLLLRERGICGNVIQSLLRRRPRRTRLVQTDGSFENAMLLRDSATIAIMQYDAALASRFGDVNFVYGADLPGVDSVPIIEGLRRIAVLHEERVHVVARRDRLSRLSEMHRRRRSASRATAITTLNDLADAVEGLSSEGEKLSIGLGPERSATRMVAEAILTHHGIAWSSIRTTFLSVSDMARRLHDGDIDLGFFVSYVPSEALKTVLNDRRFRLLSLGSEQTAPLTSTVFTAATIEPGTYACQDAGEAAIQTIATRAVLVTTEDLPFSVREITDAVFQGEVFLGIEGGARTMAQHLPSIPLHAGAIPVYQEVGYLPSKPPIDWVGITWRVLASIVILVGGYRGLLTLRRETTYRAIGRRILAIPLDVGTPDSVARLVAIRDEIRERVRKRWWRPGELDKPRWRDLRSLIQDRLAEARDNLTRSLASDMYGVASNPDLDAATRSGLYDVAEARVWQYFADGELDASQHQMLDTLISSCRQRHHPLSASPSTP